jgi:hypothetical protein
MTRTIINPATGLKCRQAHREVNHCVRSKCLSVKQRQTLMLIKRHILETMEATQMGMSFVLTAYLARQQILNNTGGTETDFSLALSNLLDTIYQQMVSSQIFYHYYKTLDKIIAEIPHLEDTQPKYYQAPCITRIYHFQNDDEARNMTRFTKSITGTLLPANQNLHQRRLCN